LSAAALTVVASLLFASMGVCIKFVSEFHGSGEIVAYRSAIGALIVWGISLLRKETLRTTCLRQHLERGAIGALALVLWFQAIAALPLATAVTLNYTSSVWLAVILVVSQAWFRGQRIEWPLLVCVLIGFLGVVLVLRPTASISALPYGFLGLTSGLLAAVGYLQVAALGRAGETETRMVMYFSLAGVVVGGALATAQGWQPLRWSGAAWLLGVGVLSTFAQLLLTRAYALGATLMTASLQYLGIAFSFAYGLVLFDDAFSLMATLGIALIVLAGVGATRTQRRVSLARPPAPADSATR
jgi:drug/metabolite transporter (DMT)-like permease